MAAGGYREFLAGETLDEDAINDYLMQGVLVFAGTAARGSAISSPVEGQFAFLKDTDALTYYSGTAWEQFVSGIGPATVSGTTGSPTVTSGTVISGVTYDIYTFNGDGSITFSEAGLVDCLIVGAGSSGGGPIDFNNASGGSGGGGVGIFSNVFVPAASQTVKVGAGGATVGSDAPGNRGGDSFLGNYNVAAGGPGGNRFGEAGATGGAGASLTGTLGVAVTSIYGKNGGTGFLSATIAQRAGGGGGGANQVGSNAAAATGGKGGDGLATTITGTSVTYGGGGGGGAQTGTGGLGGTGGGGNGGSSGSAPTAGQANTGGGGGGTSRNSHGSGAGGSGRVIVRVQV